METVQVLGPDDVILKGDVIKPNYPLGYYSNYSGPDKAFSELIVWKKVENYVPFWVGKRLGDLNLHTPQYTVIRYASVKPPYGFIVEA